MDEPTLTEETEALEASPPSGDRARDQRIILGNTGQNVLGLAIVRAVAEAHGGSAEASNADGGASVVLVIPATG